MTLKTTLQDDVKAAMRAREAERLSALRLLMAAIKQREVDERVELDDDGVRATIQKLLKQRRDAASQYDAANRPELAAKERFEIDVLSAYLPAALSEAEVDAVVSAALVETGASTPADMGKVMGLLNARLAGRADMAQVSARMRAALKQG